MICCNCPACAEMTQAGGALDATRLGSVENAVFVPMSAGGGFPALERHQSSITVTPFCYCGSTEVAL
jgi:hypothetical protein